MTSDNFVKLPRYTSSKGISGISISACGWLPKGRVAVNVCECPFHLLSLTFIHPGLGCLDTFFNSLEYKRVQQSFPPGRLRPWRSFGTSRGERTHV